MGGQLKLNMDGSSHGNLGYGGGGGFLRDGHDKVLVAFAEYYGYVMSLQVKARALCTSLTICALEGLSNIVVEMDSKVLQGILTSKSLGPVSIRLVIWKIRLFEYLVGSFTHCFREANKVADSLAGFTVSSGSSLCFALNIPFPG